MIKIAVFDDNNYRRESLDMLIGMTGNMQCTGTFPDCRHVIEDIQAAVPDVVLMDIDMPEITGIEGAEIIKKNFPSIHILMQTVFDDNAKVFASICAGAEGYILKKSTPAQIIQAIEDVYNGDAVMTGSIAKQVLRAFREQKFFQTPANFNLSEKEKIILSGLVNGLSYKMIAHENSISYHTVNSHIKKIYEKLHVNSVSEAVAKAIKEKIV
jgi:DNA-binding NarL/FixJ family response regulator